MVLQILSIFFLSCSLLSGEIYFYKNNKKVILTPLEANASQTRGGINPHAKSSSIKYFYVNGKNVVGVGDELLVKTKHIEKILQKYDLELVRELSDCIYLLKVKDSSLTIESANKLYEDSDVELSHPNFTRDISKR